MMKLISIIFFLLFLFGTNPIFSQKNVDSIIRDYLKINKQLENPVKIVKRSKGKSIITTNYFKDEKSIIRVENKYEIKVTIFGSYSTHASKYLFLNIIGKNIDKQWILGSKRFEEELDNLFQILKNEIGDEERQDQKAALVNYLSFCYM